MVTANPTMEAFKQMVHDEWTDETTITGWRRWHPGVTIQCQEMTDAILATAHIQPGMRVLDLACGPGEPAFAIARAVGPDGQVTATDLSPGMIAVAEENAAREHLTNIIFQQGDAHALPFVDETFDAVMSRLGVMYFTDIQQALGEIRRVLRPGGHLSFVAWGPADQGTYVLSMLMPFFKRVEVPPPPPDAPQPFRFAPQGTLSAELEHAGFRQVDEEHRVIDVSWPGPPEDAWQQFYDVAVPVHPLVDGLPADERARAIAEVIGGLRDAYDGQRVHLSAVIVVASAVR